ncbi:MAG: beta-lactamase family protein [Lachnospiraceae bacterium]|nr:beta-lactamase family protein [Lachnospiraceae bacterium]
MNGISKKIKLVTALYKYIEDKKDEIPLYFGNDISTYLPGDRLEDTFLKKEFPNKSSIRKLIKHLTDDRDIAMKAIGVLYQGHVVVEHYNYPFTGKFRYVSYSLAKTVTALGVGAAIDRGLLTLDTKISDIFTEHNKIFQGKQLKSVTVKHLLTMTAGVGFCETDAIFSFDWCKDYMSSHPKFFPGEDFYYNSLNTYMLVALISKVAKKSFMDFMKEAIFEPMDIHDITWDKCPQGIERGGWGIKLSLADMLKFGKLILDDGVWNTKKGRNRLVSSEFIKDMRSCHTRLTNKKLVDGYGYGIWLLKDGSFLANGLFGQNIYINPDRELVIAIMASAKEMFPDGKTVKALCDFASKDSNFLFSNILWDGWYLNKSKKVYLKGKNNLKSIKSALASYLGNEYRFTDYASNILPLSSQLMYSNYMSKIRSLKLDIVKDNFVLRCKDRDGGYNLNIGYTRKKPYIYQLLTINGKQMPVAVSGSLLYDEEDRLLLKIHIAYLEEVGDRIFKIYFEDGRIRLKSYETPDLIGFIDKFIDEEFFDKIKKAKDRIPPDYLNYSVKKILRPNVIGYIDE